MALIIFPDDEPFMFAPNLQVEEIQKSSFNGPVYGYADQEDPWSKIVAHVGKLVSDPHYVGFEATNLVYSIVKALEGAFEYATFDHDVSNLIKQMRMIKTPEEIKKLEGDGREAQQMATDYAKPGVTAESIDKVARDHIAKAGYGKYFLHRLGYGIGLSTHEFPTIRGGNKTVIKPGIYVPGVARVRIEDCVHVTETSVESFTHTSKHLIYVD